VSHDSGHTQCSNSTNQPTSLATAVSHDVAAQNAATAPNNPHTKLQQQCHMIAAAHNAVTALHDGPSLLESSRVREKSLCLDQAQGINMPLEQSGIPLDLDQVSCEKHLP